MKTVSRAALGVLVLMAMITLLSFASAKGEFTGHTPTAQEVATATLLRENAYNVIIVSAVLLIILVVYSIKKKPRKEKIKRILFGAIVVLAVGSNLYLAGMTIYTNTVSPTGGPVHWHTDYEVWNCGTRIELINPTGIDNRVGTWEVHEHNDDRMHIEGTILDRTQASFKHFFEITGGTMAPGGMTMPTPTGNVTMPVSGTCNGQSAQLQGFLYRVTNPEDAKNWRYEQTKIAYPFNEIMAPYSNVPPGDCLIIEYGPVKERTDKLCASYDSARNRGEFDGS